MTGREQPEDIAHGFIDAWNTYDGDAIADLFVADADFVNVVGLWWRNRKQIRTAHRYGLSQIFSESTMAIRRISVRKLGEDVAVVHVAWTLRDQNSHVGREAGVRKGVLSYTAQRQTSGDWLAVSAHNTDRINGAETLIQAGNSLEPAHYGQA